MHDTEKELENCGKKATAGFFEKSIDKSIDFLFSKDSRKWVLLIFLLGLIIRILSAIRIDPDADEMIYMAHSIGFIESGKLQPMDQNAVWFWLTDLSMKILGSNFLGGRFLSVIFGAFSIVLVYLIGKKLFSNRVGLIAATIFAFEPFQLFHTVGEMDIPMAFFAILAMYLLILFFETNKNKFFVFAWMSLGIAIMTKTIALLFIPAFVLFTLYYNKKHYKIYKFKQIIYAAIIIFVMVSPIMVHNYLLCKHTLITQDKCVLDLQFARFTRISIDTYADIAPSIKPFSFARLFLPYNNGLPGFFRGFKYLYTWGTSFTLLFAIIGLFYLIKAKSKYFWLLFLSFFCPFLFVAGTSLMSKHFCFGSYFVALLASLAIANISDKINPKKYSKIFLYLVIALILILSIFRIYTDPRFGGLFGDSPLGNLIDFKNEQIDKNALVVVDARIYRGQMAFMFWDTHYLEASYLQQVLQNQASFPGTVVSMPTYYIEAAADDSGWGTIGSQPEFNQSMEEITSLFEQSSQKIATINSFAGTPFFNIYKTTINLKSSVLAYADTTHMWYYYPLEYKPLNQNFDYYEIYNAFDSLLNKFAHLVLYFDILAAIYISVYLFYRFYKSSLNK